MRPPPGSVVVAVGAGEHGPALRLGVAEAGRTGLPLRLVHVVETVRGGREVVGAARLLDEGHRHLAWSATRATALGARRSTLSTQLVSGGPVPERLAHAVEHATVLVLQHRTFGRGGAGSRCTVADVAGRVTGSLLRAPSGWRPETDSTGVVTVAVQEPVAEHALLREGVERAAVSAARVVVLHARGPAPGLGLADGGGRERESRTLGELDAAVRASGRTAPSVPIAVDLRHEPPVDALLDAAARSDLVLLGRHHTTAAGHRLGRVASACLLHAGCPVWIAPERTATVAELLDESLSPSPG